VNPSDYKYVQEYVKEQSGIVLSEGKEYLLESRLSPLVRNTDGMSSIDDLIQAMRDPANQHLRDMVVEAMTTNESFFFRDKTPFNHFNEIMAPAMLEGRDAQKRLRIWCAAASSGQEPYSLGMCIKEMADKFANWQIDILGTDLSLEILEKAKSGMYSQFEVQRGLPIQMLMKYFTQLGESWQVNAELRGMVDYKANNLLKDFSSYGKFDIIFCRNVLIYFDEETKRDILARLAKQLEPDGFLILGAAETVIGLSDTFTRFPNKAGLYVIDSKGAEAVVPVAAVTGMAG